MKIISYEHQGKARWGMVAGTGVVALDSADYPTLLGALQAGKLDDIAADAQSRAPHAQLADIKFLPVIPSPGKIFCVGHNYEAHRVETQRDPTQHPLLFMRVAESQTAHRQPILLPPESTQLDYEGEIAVVIGKAGRRIRATDASATGKSTPSSSPPEKTSPAPAPLAPGWSRAARLPTAKS
jgi:2-keto-4-pentenoate hydratase/2-oxohepta-3-ene-1,7-dioic acid hydratase in catechol pathway